MNACMSVINSSSRTISVHIDDEPFSFLLPRQRSKCKYINAGSIAIKIFDSREKLIFDSWLSIMPENRHLLEVFDTDFNFKSVPHP